MPGSASVLSTCSSKKTWSTPAGSSMPESQPNSRWCVAPFMDLTFSCRMPKPPNNSARVGRLRCAKHSLSAKLRRKIMRKKISAIAIKSFALLVVLGTAYLGTLNQAMAQAVATTYTKMAPIDQYLMTDQAAEIALARSAAPESISRDAEVLVLGRHGFETAVKGKNGFVCIVGRSWTSAADADFWNPKVRVPMCVNAAAAHSYLLHFTKETEWGLAGRTQAQMTESITAAIAKKDLPAMESGAMCYMLSKQGYGGDSTPHWPPHLMFFYSDTNPAIWGANLPGSPVVGMSDPVEHLTQFVIPVQRWSDGTENR